MHGFSFDSFLLTAALLLFVATALVWVMAADMRAASRLNIRFAAMLFAALAVACLAAARVPAFIPVAFAVALLVASLASAMLMLGMLAALSSALPLLGASLALSAALAAGLGACLSGNPVYALAMQCVFLMAGIAQALLRVRRHPLAALEAMLGAAALIAGGMALLEGALAMSLLFFAAGLFGLACALQVRVAEPRHGRGFALIGRHRF